MTKLKKPQSGSKKADQKSYKDELRKIMGQKFSWSVGDIKVNRDERRCKDPEQ